MSCVVCVVCVCVSRRLVWASKVCTVLDPLLPPSLTRSSRLVAAAFALHFCDLHVSAVFPSAVLVYVQIVL
jgi:hypothetical protein